MGADGYGAGEAISTVCLFGFPPDSLPRELDNLCRFMPGFVTSNLSTTKGNPTLFVLFDQPMNAQYAIELLNGQMYDRTAQGEPMRAQMSRSQMRSSANPAPVARPVAYGPPSKGGWGGGAPPGQPPPPPGPPPTQRSYPVNIAVEGGAGTKRPRIPEDPTQVDTVASVGAKEAGFDEHTLRSFYQQLPGFVDFKGNPRMGGGFAKFESVDFAIQAIEFANAEGIPAEMAKSSMGSSASAAPAPAPRPGPAWGSGGGSWGYGSQQASAAPPPAKRPRIPEDPSQVDTVASVGAKEKGFDEGRLHEFFQQCHGFVAFKANPRMGGGFAKFESSAAAVDAVSVAQTHGVPAEIAKSSMAA